MNWFSGEVRMQMLLDTAAILQSGIGVTVLPWLVQAKKKQTMWRV
jgi:hypothetical protein